MRDPKDKEKKKSQAPDLEAEIRRGRKFSLAEAVGRAAGGNLKGASPVAPARQLVLQIEEILASLLPDSEGSLCRTIIARFNDNPPLLARHFGEPTAALTEFLDDVLNTPTALDDLVRQADARWGREFDERPHFEKPGQAPHPDDPYTGESVRARLCQLRRDLTR